MLILLASCQKENSHSVPQPSTQRSKEGPEPITRSNLKNAAGYSYCMHKLDLADWLCTEGTCELLLWAPYGDSIRFETKLATITEDSLQCHDLPQSKHFGNPKLSPQKGVSNSELVALHKMRNSTTCAANDTIYSHVSSNIAELKTLGCVATSNGEYRCTARMTTGIERESELNSLIVYYSLSVEKRPHSLDCRLLIPMS